MLTFGSCCIVRTLLRIACSDTMLRDAAPQNRGGNNAALALVGDFKTFDTASVQKVDVSRLKLPPETGAATRAHESTSQASCPNWKLVQKPNIQHAFPCQVLSSYRQNLSMHVFLVFQRRRGMPRPLSKLSSMRPAQW